MTDADVDGAENEQRSNGNIGRGQRFVDCLGQKDIGIDSARETFGIMRCRMLKCGKRVGLVIHEVTPPQKTVLVFRQYRGRAQYS